MATQTMSTKPLTAMNTPKQVADYYQVSVEYLAQQRYLGKGPSFVRVGRLVRYTREAVEDYMAQNTVTAV